MFVTSRIRAVTRSSKNPVYGVIIHQPRSIRMQDLIDRNRAFQDFTQYYDILPAYEVPRKDRSAVRLIGGRANLARSGSFQHLKVFQLYFYLCKKHLYD